MAFRISRWSWFRLHPGSRNQRIRIEADEPRGVDLAPHYRATVVESGPAGEPIYSLNVGTGMPAHSQGIWLMLGARHQRNILIGSSNRPM